MKHSCVAIHCIPMKYAEFYSFLLFLYIAELFSFTELRFHHSGTTPVLKDKAGCRECHITLNQSKLGSEKQYILLALLIKLI